MNEYVIFTDSASDIKPELLAQWGVSCASLTFRFEGEGVEYKNDEMTSADFYAKMREGGIAKTSAINAAVFESGFEEILAQGKDILYLGFSSGLSTTSNSARIAAKQLAAKYPERKIVIIDTLCASAGQGMVVYFASEKQKGGASIDENEKYIRALLPHICHWFTVDDLVYLKRGGRVSPAAAFFGNALGIKPVLHVDSEGHLTAVSKVRGRRNAIVELALKYGEFAKEPGAMPVFVSHGDCMADVRLLEKELADRYGAKLDIITDVGPVIGAHSGPGTLALFFIGKER